MTTFCSAGRRLAIHSSALVALIATAAITFADTAHAGSYSARFCVQGVTPEGDKGPFERFGNQAVYTATNNCGNFNGLRVSHNAGQQGNIDSEAGWLAERPDGVTIARIDYKASGNGASGGYRPQVIGDADSDPQLDIINGARQLTGNFQDFSVSGDVRRFGVRLVCVTDASPTCGANPSNPEVKVKNVNYTMVDSGAPALSVAGGTLFSGEVQTYIQTVTASAVDGGSGVRRIVVYANGKPAGVAGPNCAANDQFAVAFKPCPAEFAGDVSVNTAVEPFHNGMNKVQVCVEDYATDGNPNTSCSGVTKVRVLNGCAVNPAPVNVGQTLTLQWPGKRNAPAQTRQGRARTAIATVYGPNGTPLAGAQVCISRSIPDGSGHERVIEPGAITGPDGSVRVKVRGASSRTVYATYWVDAETVITSSIEMKVAPRIKLRVEPSGEVERGKKVLVVAKLRGKWRADRKVCFYAKRPGNDRFQCTKTGDGGRAKAYYQPKKSGRIYFYAKVPRQKGFPFANARSKKKHLRVID